MRSCIRAIYQPRCKSLFAALSVCLVALARIYPGRYVSIYLPTSGCCKRRYLRRIMRDMQARTCSHIHAYTHTCNADPGPVPLPLRGKEALPTRANACLAPFHPRLFPPLTHLLILRDGNSDRDNVHKPRRTNRDRNFMRRKTRVILQHVCIMLSGLTRCAPSADGFRRNAPHDAEAHWCSRLFLFENISYESFENFFKKTPGVPHLVILNQNVRREKSCKFFSCTSK